MFSRKMAEKQLTCLKKLLLSSLFCLNVVSITAEYQNGEETREENAEMLKPTIMVAILVRNKAHALPWFFGHFESLNYPKDRMAIWIESDHNSDDSANMLKQWESVAKHHYHSVHLSIDDDKPAAFVDEAGPCDWSDKRFEHVIKLRQAALDAARKIWADYLFMLDADVILENPETLNYLIEDGSTIVAPMLNSSMGDAYSNFWGGMTEQGYYKRVPEYFDIVDRKVVGSFVVPMVHTAMLINLHHADSQKLAYKPSPRGYKGPKDDIIIFAHSAKFADIEMRVVNTAYFGIIMVPLDSHNTLTEEKDHFIFVRLEAMDADFIYEELGPRLYPVKRPGLIHTHLIQLPPVPKDKMGFDEIYMINLVRRPERRERMLVSLDVLGIDVKVIDAVDGKQLNSTYLEKQKIVMMPGYADPYHKRTLTMGEIGCFLSHYFIWKEVIDKGYDKVVVFEDDVRFEPYFKLKIERMMEEVEESVPNWDLIYLGRKRLNIRDEVEVDGSKMLVWPSYSYWTLSYLLSHRGATKLLQQDPLQKMIPVDEYLPIMFDKHPETDWKSFFGPRNLVGLSANPLLVYPTHYTGEANYFSDTEDSSVVDGWKAKDEL